MPSCFIMRTTSSSSSTTSRNSKIRSWRWWRKCAARLAAAGNSKLRRSVRWSPAAPVGLGGRNRRRSAAAPLRQRGHQYHRRSFAPVYVDELYSHSQQPKSPRASQSCTRRSHTPASSHRTAAGDGTTARAASGNKARRVRSVLLSPMRGGGVSMGEVDLRAEVFIRKFREEMRLQSQRSAEEFQAMVARGL